METKIKWNEGEGYITATYEGSGSGSASISSDVNKGIDREQSITVETTNGSVSATLVVTQEGLREVFLPSDDDFILADGGTFNVLKGGGGEEPVETYVRLAYLESTGVQHIMTDYVVKETDTIEARFISTDNSSKDHFLFCTSDNNTSLYCDIYANTAYLRFGYTSAKTISKATSTYNVTLKKSSATMGASSVSLEYTAMPVTPLCIFSGYSGESTYGYGLYRLFYLRITDGDGNMALDMLPYKRVSDGKVGLMDVVSGKFYVNGDDGDDFLSGGIADVTEGYELMEYTTFNQDKMFDAVAIEDDYQIDVFWAKASSSGAQYLYGMTTSGHTASVMAYLSSGGSWRWGSKYVSFTTNNTNDHYAVITNGTAKMEVTTRTFTANDFTTPYALVLGGYRDYTDYESATFAGKVYAFRIKDADGNDLVDWIPCKRLSDEVEGFWDCVTQSFVSPI